MSTSRPQPAAIATWTFGRSAAEAAGELLCKGATALDAVEKGINVVELDPSVTGVGFGGLPNAEGIVELDAAIMDGATYRAGSVGALRNIKCPISVARKVMEQTPHVMLAGDNALAFALSQGFHEEELLTPESRRRWEEWKGGRAPSHDTVSLVALDCEGRLAAGCSTSGLAYKVPGRVGDSPIIGAGLYVDGDAGGAAATGIGEEIMRFCASFLVVEFMRNGSGPAEACGRVLDRIASKKPADREANICLIALARDGEYGAAGMRPRFPYAVWTPAGVQTYEAQ
jgi:isoaspartyl peptidase/L-asparaginase-like protein (Ntn-hydrolase superfamily)